MESPCKIKGNSLKLVQGCCQGTHHLSSASFSSQPTTFYSLQYGVVLSHKALELLRVILLLVSQRLDKRAFPGVSAPLNLVESLPCRTVGLSSPGTEFGRPGIIGMLVWENLLKLEEPRASHRERHGSLW